MKLTLTFIMALVMSLTGPSLSFAGIDMQKWEAFVKSELESIAQQVDATGRAPVSRPFVGDYDLNKDNFIDTVEVKAIKAYLGKTPQVQPTAIPAPVAVKPVAVQAASNYQASTAKDSKKKEWWKN